MKVCMISGRPTALALALVMLAAAAGCSDSTLPSGAGQAAGTGGTTVPDNPIPDNPLSGEPIAGGGANVVGPAEGSQARTAGPEGTGSAGTPTTRPVATTSGSTVGVTKNTIALSVSGFWTGAYAAFTNKQFDNGFMTWVNEVNGRGGIHGRKITVKKVDNQGTAEGAIAACKEAASNGAFIVVGITAGPAEMDCLDRAGVPALTLGADRDPESWRVGRAIESEPSQGTAMASFARAKLGAADKKIGVMVVNYSQTIAAASQFAVTARKLGLNIVNTEKVEQNQASFIPQLSRMRGAGAELVVLFVLTEVLGVLRDAKGIGYEPTFTGTIWTVDDLSQVARDLMDGIKGLRVVTTVDTPAYKAYKAEATKQGKSNASATDSRYYGVGQVVGHVLQAAGSDLTRESFVAAVDGTRGFDGGIIQPVSWNPPDRIGTRAQFPVVCCNPDYTWRSLGPAQANF